MTRHRWALAGGHAELDLFFGEGRHIDPLLTALAIPERRSDEHLELPAEQPALVVLSA